MYPVYTITPHVSLKSILILYSYFLLSLDRQSCLTPVHLPNKRLRGFPVTVMRAISPLNSVVIYHLLFFQE